MRNLIRVFNYIVIDYYVLNQEAYEPTRIEIGTSLFILYMPTCVKVVNIETGITISPSELLYNSVFIFSPAYKFITDTEHQFYLTFLKEITDAIRTFKEI